MKDRWTIVRCSCQCGGRYAWLLNDRMMGCVCHHWWTLVLRIG